MTPIDAPDNSFTFFNRMFTFKPHNQTFNNYKLKVYRSAALEIFKLDDRRKRPERGFKRKP